jgi:hypothetical protein
MFPYLLNYQRSGFLMTINRFACTKIERMFFLEGQLPWRLHPAKRCLCRERIRNAKLIGLLYITYRLSVLSNYSSRVDNLVVIDYLNVDCQWNHRDPVRSQTRRIHYWLVYFLKVFHNLEEREHRNFYFPKLKTYNIVILAIKNIPIHTRRHSSRFFYSILIPL